MNKNIIISFVVILVLLVGGGLYFFMSNKSKPQTKEVAVGVTPQATQQDTNTVNANQVEANTVEIKGFAYNPATITIKVGTTVTWVNSDSVGHTATAEDGSFDTGMLRQGEKGSVTFSKAGTFKYICTPHPYMKGAVVVTE